MLIIRRSYCNNTASGMVFSASDHPVCGLRSHLQRILHHNAVLLQFDLVMMSTELLETYRGL